MYEINPRELVQYTTRGRRYHVSGALGPCGTFLANAPATVEETTAEEATRRGKTPCQECFGK